VIIALDRRRNTHPSLQRIFALLWTGTAVFVLSASSASAAESLLPALQPANADLQAGRADDAVVKLNSFLKADPNSAPADNLLCRVEYSLQQFDQAAGHCEQAVKASPQDARDHLWLGRAIGERASRASAFSAFSLAKRTRQEFETSVSLDPHDAEALADLGEFYKDAPGIIGGGVDKAQDIAAKLMPIDPSRAHNLLGEIAEKNKDLSTAEQEFKSACTGRRAAAQWMELAAFYRRHERWSDLDSAIKNGQAAVAKDKHQVAALCDGASTLVRANRDLELAVKLYEGYLTSPDKTEDAPAFDILARLAKLRKHMGDAAGAERDKAAALALAHDYKPALEATKDEKGK
jgi:tetratricopeptide (TPR) repeat protein